MLIAGKGTGILIGALVGLSLAGFGAAGWQSWQLSRCQDNHADALADLKSARQTNARNADTIREMEREALENVRRLREARAQAQDAEERRVAARDDSRSRIAATEAELQEALSRDPTNCDTVYPGDDVDRMLSGAADRIQASTGRPGADRPRP